MLKSLSYINKELHEAIISNSDVKEDVLESILNAEVYLKSRVSISFDYSEFNFLTLVIVYTYYRSENKELNYFSLKALGFFFKEFTYYDFFFAYDSFYFSHSKMNLDDFFEIISIVTHFNPADFYSEIIINKPKGEASYNKSKKNIGNEILGKLKKNKSVKLPFGVQEVLKLSLEKSIEPLILLFKKVDSQNAEFFIRKIIEKEWFAPIKSLNIKLIDLYRVESLKYIFFKNIVLNYKIDSVEESNNCNDFFKSPIQGKIPRHKLSFAPYSIVKSKQDYSLINLVADKKPELLERYLLQNEEITSIISFNYSYGMLQILPINSAQIKIFETKAGNTSWSEISPFIHFGIIKLGSL